MLELQHVAEFLWPVSAGETMKVLAKILAGLILVLILSAPLYSQELPTTPEPKPASIPASIPASKMTKADRDAYLCQKYGCDKPVTSRTQAAFSGPMPYFIGGFIAASVYDIEGTQHCIANHTCKESNPLLGQTRAQAYSVSAGLGAAVIFSALQLRKNNHGTVGYALLWVPTVLHISFGTEAIRR
jgi:hypothetical protein